VNDERRASVEPSTLGGRRCGEWIVAANGIDRKARGVDAERDESVADGGGAPATECEVVALGAGRVGAADDLERDVVVISAGQSEERLDVGC
jgi:hypothetical protein